MVETEIPSCSACSADNQESGRGCRCYSQIPRTGLRYVDCCCLRTSGFRLSFGFSPLIILFLLMSMSLLPCACGLNCTNYNVSCYRGTCVEAVRNLNRTIVCVCEDRWSGPACDVFVCSGRTLWVPIVVTVLSGFLSWSSVRSLDILCANSRRTVNSRTSYLKDNFLHTAKTYCTETTKCPSFLVLVIDACYFLL